MCLFEFGPALEHNRQSDETRFGLPVWRGQEVESTYYRNPKKQKQPMGRPKQWTYMGPATQNTALAKKRTV